MSDAAGAAGAGAGAEGTGAGPAAESKGTAIIVIGMAGSGKTTFNQRLNAHLYAAKRPVPEPTVDYPEA